ncbi:PAS domain S-box-containing protein [Noviherbaspirillum humi]|uniref:PAS domain S-box-containing protein n=1 Tax=Noviherbaspirillum humi TaxID=1688639 RepID=A0A239KZ37_9BURK|nr:PAS domain S-box protein [Noviherbaspirillum humi]SNT23481.1 PAS domain S-box-containing protein [Noviherbaspirillum humi]
MDAQIDAATFIEQAADAIVIAAPNGAITVWNAAAERLFGFTSEEALGRSLDIIIPERFRRRHWEGYDQAMQSGFSRYGADDLLRVPALHRDGRALSIAFTVTMLKDEAGKVAAIAAIIRDETARWAEEKQLKQRLAALECGKGGAGAAG